MATEKQIAANRANAKHSTGPRTAAGKLKSSRNTYRHGLSGPTPFDLPSAAEVNCIALGGPRSGPGWSDTPERSSLAAISLSR